MLKLFNIKKHYKYTIKNIFCTKYIYNNEKHVFSCNNGQISLEKNNSIIAILNFILLLEKKPTVLRNVVNKKGIKQAKIFLKYKGFNINPTFRKWKKSNVMQLSPWHRYCKITKKFIKIINWNFFSYKKELKNNDYLEKFSISISFSFKKGTLCSKLFFLQNLNLIKRYKI